jgi:glycylpeptide N-tetradecanoyltransferase
LDTCCSSPETDEDVTQQGPLDEPKTPADVKQEPYNLPDGFKWVDIDVTSDEEIKELYELLSFNYVEDDDNMFRFDYSPEFLRW